MYTLQAQPAVCFFVDSSLPDEQLGTTQHNKFVMFNERLLLKHGLKCTYTLYAVTAVCNNVDIAVLYNELNECKHDVLCYSLTSRMQNNDCFQKLEINMWYLWHHCLMNIVQFLVKNEQREFRYEKCVCINKTGKFLFITIITFILLF